MTRARPPKNRKGKEWQTDSGGKARGGGSVDRSTRAQRPTRSGEYRHGPKSDYQERRGDRSDHNPDGRTPSPPRPSGKDKPTRVRKQL